ncbi:protein TRACHEARY ELEMENT DIFFERENTIATION-RELATED 7A-like [Alosa alosa]|uniref:protein TRACHEARY ELEMENT DIFFERENTIATION-RELATED 7A-like n=1 Tax=Alosa alosa TaxID=278164 RepID=UPI0020154FB4|nr:protein TRACHEARY ELEMENT DIFFERENTIATION-RELATED 7A-like [Alosa alosa]
MAIRALWPPKAAFPASSYLQRQTPRTTPHHPAPHHTTPHHPAPHRTTPHHTTPPRTTLHHTTPHHTAPPCTTPPRTTPHLPAPHRTEQRSATQHPREGPRLVQNRPCSGPESLTHNRARAAPDLH